MKTIITRVASVRPHGDNLSIVTLEGIETEVVANRKEDGSFRWEAGEACAYVPEKALIPDDVLQERGYWDEEKGKGLLEGKKGNRVKKRNFAGFPSIGLLFKVETESCLNVVRGDETMVVDIGDDVSEFLGITEWIPQ